MDLDRFKHVNDVLGHRFGDRLLPSRGRTCAARRWPRKMAWLDSVAMICHFAAQHRPHAAHLLARRILRAFERPFSLDDRTVDLSAVLALPAAPTTAWTWTLLMSRRAEMAMYAAKQNQSGCVTYHPGLDSSAKNR